MSIKTVMDNIKLEDLVVETEEITTKKPSLTNAKIEEVLKYLKYRNGGVGAGEYAGFGDNQIIQTINITKEDLENIKEARINKINELRKTQESKEIN